MQRILLSTIVLLAGCLALPAFAQQQASSQDKTWLKTIHQVDLEEIQSGQLAQQKGHASDVRSTGETLASDHRQLDAKVKALAQQLGVALPNEPTARDQKDIHKLEGKSGAAFDKAYVKGEIKGHKQAIARTKKEISDGSSSQVKQLAQQALPQLEKHLQMVEHDQSAM